MRTDELIRALAADTRVQPTAARLLLPALGLAGLVSPMVFVTVYGGGRSPTGRC
jgi:hypothetical protein